MTTAFNYDDLFGSDYLKAGDLPDEGVQVFTITDYEVSEIGPTKEAKCMLSFHETKKKLVLNRTNGRTLAEMFGKDAEDWVGKRVGLFSTTVDFAGKQVPAIRVKLRVPKQQPVKVAAPEPEFPDDPPSRPEFDDGDEY